MENTIISNEGVAESTPLSLEEEIARVDALFMNKLQDAVLKLQISKGDTDILPF